MKIFCDTNIITEFLEKRLLFDAVAKILTLASTRHTLFLSEGGFYTITFLVDKQLRRMSIYNPERLVQERKILLRILDTFQISSASRFGLKQGVEDENFRDLEDSYQYQAAINCGADILLTINVKDFVGVSDNKRIKIMTPQSFVDEFLSNTLATESTLKSEVIRLMPTIQGSSASHVYLRLLLPNGTLQEFDITAPKMNVGGKYELRFKYEEMQPKMNLDATINGWTNLNNEVETK